MNPAVKLAGFVAVLGLVFGAASLASGAEGPLQTPEPEAAEHGGEMELAV